MTTHTMFPRMTEVEMFTLHCKLTAMIFSAIISRFGPPADRIAAAKGANDCADIAECILRRCGGEAVSSPISNTKQ